MSTTPHDDLAQYVFGDPTRAGSLLRAVLPAALAAHVDWASLERENARYTNVHLARREGDLLFSALLGTRRAFFYVMFEHQSDVDRLMAGRVHIYMGRVWEAYIRRHGDVTTLPFVLPVVLFHDTCPWDAPTDVADLLDLDADLARDLAPHLPRGRFLLVDLDALQDDALRALSLTSLVRLALVLMRDTRRLGWAELHGRLMGWKGAFLEVLRAPEGVAAAAALMRYILLTSPASQDEVRELALELEPAAEEALMTAGEQLRQEGVALGRAEGKAEGKTEGKVEALLRILTRRFGPLSSHVAGRIQAAGHDQLDLLIDRALAADTLEDALG